MANRQTRFLAHMGKSAKANRLPGGGSPSIVQRPVFRGSACDTAFANAPGNGSKHKHAHRYVVDSHMSVGVQYAILGLRTRKAE